MGRRRGWTFLGWVTWGCLLALLWLPLSSTWSVGRSQPDPNLPDAPAQILINPRLVAETLYPKLPGLPKENHYIRQDNRQPAPESTLLERFIVYHTTVKGRSPLYRFDWKISLADYLGLNDFLRRETYPGRSYLTVNPMEGDMAAIRQLNRQQRDALVSTLATFYAQQAGLPTTTPQRPQPQTTLPEPTWRPPTVLPPVPQPGSAGLLAPPESPRPLPTGESRFLLP
ncbi:MULTISPECIES: hypothetical protein [unclassified Thermosynechococcus]|uniref:hypothetical protein n=1 Tax=unclassified Thermosynechococcus TaxID=2622553 RepID=UPI00197D259E|nr:MULTISPECIES: hypothetical protein [unclassified Thermosynechococcus]QSF48438.1 hypothetical protein JW907_08730 [Thermosynechococcus sp. TA-1]WNC21475.1 hypothetical protein RHG98_08715 [Thermosynechococcus sp. PP22]WNC29153.1 hypothetical protein RHH53_08785 [Thermosynechococcus sp. PKX82]WNC31715.1 hypothetical protein RHH81_08680 [Thermosynechococcus sp. PKX95]WNC34239.1 hypothetical protein RHH79_08675 [Thermosynechococcus sp. PKX91]